MRMVMMLCMLMVFEVLNLDSHVNAVGVRRR